jgi:hypothetical protein
MEPQPFPKHHAHYTAQDLDLDLRISRMFWGYDAVYKASIFRFDPMRSQVDDVYGETLAEEKFFFAPVEVTVVPNIGEVTNTFKVAGGVAHQQYTLSLGFYLEELLTKECRPHAGDFVLYNAGQGDQFYEMAVVDELLGNNSHAGTPFYVGALCVLKGGDAIPPGLSKWQG